MYYIVYDIFVIIVIFIFSLLILGASFSDDKEGLYSLASNPFKDGNEFLTIILPILFSPAYTGMILGWSLWSAFYENKKTIFQVDSDGQLYFLFAKLSSLLTEPIYFILCTIFICIITIAAFIYLNKKRNIHSIRSHLVCFFLAEFYFLFPVFLPI